MTLFHRHWWYRQGSRSGHRSRIREPLLAAEVPGCSRRPSPLCQCVNNTLLCCCCSTQRLCLAARRGSARARWRPRRRRRSAAGCAAHPASAGDVGGRGRVGIGSSSAHGHAAARLRPSRPLGGARRHPSRCGPCAHGRRPPAISRARSASRIAPQRSLRTRSIASRTMPPLIFEAPATRSRKMIGTWTMRAPAAMRPPGRLDLEAVARAARLAQPDRLEQLAAPRLEAAGQVAVREEQDRAREQGPAAADQLAACRPADRLAAGHVARPEDEVGTSHERRQERRQVAGSWLKSASICTTARVSGRSSTQRNPSR